MNALQRLRIWWQVQKVAHATDFMVKQNKIPFYRNRAEAEAAHRHTLAQKEIVRALEATRELRQQVLNTTPTDEGALDRLATIQSALQQVQALPPPVQPINP